MKKTTKIFGLLLTLFGLALVTGCTPITDTPYVPEETTYYTVTFNTNGGSTVTSQTVKSGEKATKPANPTKQAIATETYAFENWYTSTEGDTAFDFDTAITKDITLYAKWTVTPIIKTYSITIFSEIEHGSISIQGNKTTAVKDETITLTVTPDEGYELATLTVTQGTTLVTVTDNTFIMPAGNVTVSATFKTIDTSDDSDDDSEVNPGDESSESGDEETTYTVTFIAYTTVTGLIIQPESGNFKPGDKVELKVDIPGFKNVAYVKYSGTMGNSDMTLDPKLWFKADTPVKFLYSETSGEIEIENVPSPLSEAISEIELKKKYESIKVVINEDAIGYATYTYIENDSDLYSELRLKLISYNNDHITIKFNSVSE